MGPACACHDISTMSPNDMAGQDHGHWSKSDFGFFFFVKVGTLKHFGPHVLVQLQPCLKEKVKTSDDQWPTGLNHRLIKIKAKSEKFHVRSLYPHKNQDRLLALPIKRNQNKSKSKGSTDQIQWTPH